MRGEQSYKGSCKQLKKTKNMRIKILISLITILTFVLNAKAQDTLVSAFFGLDNALPGLLCNQPGSLLDGMPVNFIFPIDASTLSESDFEVVDSLGNILTPICVSLAQLMKTEKIELCFCLVNLVPLLPTHLLK